jgi:hypothetical protein
MGPKPLPEILITERQGVCDKNLRAMGFAGVFTQEYLELVPEPSVQPTLSRAFVEHFVELCGFRPFSTK